MLRQLVNILCAAVLLLVFLSAPQAQTATVTVPLGSLNVTPPPPAPPPPPPTFSQQVSQGVNVTVLINGVQYAAVGTLAGTLTFTPVATTTTGTTTTGTTTGSTTGSSTGGTSTGGTTTGGTTGNTTGSTTGGTTGGTTTGGSITGILNSTGASVRSFNGGDTVTVLGSGFGSAGTVTVAGVAVTVRGWSPTAVFGNLGTPATFADGKVVVTPTGGQAITGGFDVSVSAPGGTTTGTTTGGTTGGTTGTTQPAPVVTGMTGVGGNPVSTEPAHDVLLINGTNLGTAGTVVFDKAGSAWINRWVDGQVTASVPDPGTGQVETDTITLVRLDGQTTQVGTLTIAPASIPTIYDLMDSTGAPVNSGSSSQSITLLGDDLGNAGTLTIGGIPVTTSRWGPKQIVMTLPTVPAPLVGPMVVTPTGRPSITRNPLAEGAGFTINPKS